ncbi:hypothetical protein [Nitrosopumilus spindle-shaped virus]|uniref:Uncharacterized protein n=1 Tax=Nitrosopumilus spindle-shaped virus TaxID=2508184 RepID=A0A514K337_9VIRU|nr:hypothetical protein [Nitrosopumilus spindle-shaped virus]
MTRKGKLRSYWSLTSNIHNKLSGTQKEKVQARKAVKKLTGVRMPTFPTIKQTRSVIKKWEKIKVKKAKEYQKEVKNQANNEKKLKLKNLSKVRKITLRGLKGSKYKNAVQEFKKKRQDILKEHKRRSKISLKDAKLMMPSFNIDGSPSEDFPSGES